MTNNDRNFADALAARDPRDPCPTCEAVGGYCGGEDHPSCGYFHDGVAVSHAEFHKKEEE